jgi:hypothetical protein
MSALGDWFYAHMGETGTGPWYAAWSGWVSDLGEVVLIGGIITAVRHINCHVKGCPRLGKHPVDGTPYKVCAKHHPDIPNTAPTHADVLAAHQEACDQGENDGPDGQDPR